MKTGPAAFVLILIIASNFMPLSCVCAEEYRRIISLAPNITETLYALGLGDEVVGVTRFCTWPPEVDDKPEVGGYFDPNIEAIVLLEPDLVIMLPAHQRLRSFLQELDIEYLILPNETVLDIVETIRMIGDSCGASERGAALADSLESAVDSTYPAWETGDSTRVLIVVDRQYGTAPEGIYAAAAGTWYDELLRAAGGMNVLKESAPAYPMLSPESLVYLQPDIIIEIVPGAEERGLDADAIIADWESFDMLEAVSGGRLHVMTGRYAAVPGPRFIRLLEEFRGMIRDGGKNKKGRPEPSLE